MAIQLAAQGDQKRMTNEKEARAELEAKLKIRDKRIDALTERVDKLEKQISELPKGKET